MWGLMLGLGVGAALILFWYLCKGKKVPLRRISENSYSFYSWVAIVAIVAGIFGAWAFQQLYEVIQQGAAYKVGMSFTFMGGLVLGVVVFVGGTAIFGKRTQKNDFYTVANLAAPCVAIALALGRFGCFFAGCCHGVESPNGLVFPHGPRHAVIPTQLYEATFMLLMFGVMMLLIFKYKKPDFLLILFGASYAVFRFIIEFWRDPTPLGAFALGMSPSQWQSIVLLLAAGALALMVYQFKKIPFYKPIPEKGEAANAVETAVENTESVVENTAENLADNQSEVIEDTDNHNE